jgi:hypothetical protein
MKTRKLNIKVRDLQPLKDVKGGSYRGWVLRFADVRVGRRLPQ